MAGNAVTEAIAKARGELAAKNRRETEERAISVRLKNSLIAALQSDQECARAIYVHDKPDDDAFLSARADPNEPFAMIVLMGGGRLAIFDAAVVPSTCIGEADNEMDAAIILADLLIARQIIKPR